VHEQNYCATNQHAIGVTRTQQQNSTTLLKQTKAEALKTDTLPVANHATLHEAQHTETENLQTQNKTERKH
jgi:hypothetical protein